MTTRKAAIGLGVVALLAMAGCKKKESAAPAVQSAPAAVSAPPAASAPAAPAETNLAGLWAGAFVVNRDKEDRSWYPLLNEIPDNAGFMRNGSRQELVIALAQASSVDELRFQGLSDSAARSNARHAKVEASFGGTQGPWTVIYDADLPARDGYDSRVPLAQPVKAQALRLTLTGNHWSGDQDEGQIGMQQFMAYGKPEAAADKMRQVGGIYQFPVEFGSSGYVLLHQDGAAVEGCYVEGDYSNQQMKIKEVLGTLSGGLENGALLAFSRTTEGGKEKGAMAFSPDGKHAYAALVKGDAKTFDSVREAGGWRLADNAPPCFPKAEAAPDPIDKAIEGAGRVQLYGVNFETDSDVLSPAARPVLDRAAKAVLAHPDWRLRVEGHTDNTGGDARNQPLSERRATAVKHYLETAGVPADRLDAKGYGASQPLMPNDTPFGRAQNRRVELARQ
jgi:outer membrane protein OmpA-like peptidoglycan-associated protein